MASSPPLPHLTLLISLLLLLQTPISLSQSCTSQTFTNNKLYTRCNDLPTLSSTLHWSYNPSKSSVSIVFIAPPPKPDGWISWALNPTGTGMAGAQALVAFRASNGSMVVKTYNISSYESIVEGKLGFDVMDMRAEYSGGLMRIFTTVGLPVKGGQTKFNQIWQVGPAVVNGFPAKHEFLPANLGSKGTVDFLSGQSTSGGTGGGMKKRNIHGILNAVSWGILFPVGAIIARYLRTFKSADPAWFYLHAFCQFSGYVVGVAGWGTGLKLGSESKGVQYTDHRNIGIALFSLATVQIFALFLRPTKDHKYRFYWNIYHHTLGYAILVLGVINVFKGLDLLDPEKKWKSAYIIVIAALGAIALLLEAITWLVVLRRRLSISTKPYDGYTNGDSRQQPLAL